MKTINQIKIIGQVTGIILTRAEDQKDGIAEALIGLAVTHNTTVDYHTIKAYGKLAEIANSYLVKGTTILAEGSLFGKIILVKEINFITSKTK